MKRLWMLSALFGSLALAGLVSAEEKTVTQKYEVVCMKCIAHHSAPGDKGGKGAGHAACAMSCSMKGTDLGLMDSKGNVYTPVDGDFKPARQAIADKAGQTVELTGVLIKTKGINYLKLADGAPQAGESVSGDKKDKNGDRDKD